jgi:hypothetical protein
LIKTISSFFGFSLIMIKHYCMLYLSLFSFAQDVAPQEIPTQVGQALAEDSGPGL